MERQMIDIHTHIGRQRAYVSKTPECMVAYSKCQVSSSMNNITALGQR